MYNYLSILKLHIKISKGESILWKEDTTVIYQLVNLPITSTGDKLYESAKRLRLPELPAFALEHLPNRNSLMYGDLYGISKEASTVYRATLRYEGKC